MQKVVGAVTGSPTDRVIYFYIGGAALSVVGLFQIFAGRN